MEGTLGEHHTNNKVQTEAVMMTVTSPLGILALVCGAATQSQYGGGAGGRAGAGGGFGGGGGNGGALEDTIPGIPGEDYPIYASVPETSFFCDGQVDGGYYGDPEAECQAFHICANDGNSGLTKFSFLCPNGTLFQQQYFVCDWWFNVDCSTTQDFWSLNDEIAAERQANSPAGGQHGAASFSSPSYSAPQSGYARHQREVIGEPSPAAFQGSILSNGPSPTFLGVHSTSSRSFNEPQLPLVQAR